MRDERLRSPGFTLMEMAVLLVVTSIFAAMLYAYFGRSITHGYVPFVSLQNSLDLSSSMDNLTSDYATIFGDTSARRWRPETAYAIGDRVRRRGPEFGHLFRCVQDGISGVDEPVWNNVPGTEIPDGGTRWVVLEGELDELVRKIPLLADGSGSGTANGVVQNYEYGRYGVDFLDFIRLRSGEERPVTATQPRSLLKVTLVNETGERITALFTTSY